MDVLRLARGLLRFGCLSGYYPRPYAYGYGYAQPYAYLEVPYGYYGRPYGYYGRPYGYGRTYGY